MFRQIPPALLATFIVMAATATVGVMYVLRGLG